MESGHTQFEFPKVGDELDPAWQQDATAAKDDALASQSSAGDRPHSRFAICAVLHGGRVLPHPPALVKGVRLPQLIVAMQRRRVTVAVDASKADASLVAFDSGFFEQRLIESQR